jgi:hypothetical protein
MVCGGPKGPAAMAAELTAKINNADTLMIVKFFVI